MEKIIGMKYQTYIENELVVLRLMAIRNENKFIMRNEKDKETKISMTNEDLDHCVILQPDALLNIMDVYKEELNIMDPYKEKQEGQITNDVEIVVGLMGDNKDSVSMVLRQNVYSSFKNSFYLNEDNRIMLGDCQSIKTISPEDLHSFLDFTKIREHLYVAAYIDDTIDSIIECIGNKAKPFNRALEKLQEEYKDNQNVDGIASDLKNLMIENRFIENFRLLFGITTIDIPIELDGIDYKDGIVLNAKQQKYFEDILKEYIGDITVLRYDKDIDISKIVAKTHIMICDANDIIYLIAYRVTGSYPIDKDIERAMLKYTKAN